MKKSVKFSGKVAGALALTALFGVSAFADSRSQNETVRDRGDRRGGYDRRDDRRHDSRRNIIGEGRVRSFHRERDGYRVQLDRGSYSYFVPQSALRYRGRNIDLRIGVNVRFGGYYDNRGYVYVDSFDYLDDGYYRDDRGHGRDTIAGRVERIDYRRDIIVLREARSGRHITVDMDRTDDRGRRGIDINDLRRGDEVRLEGRWHGQYFTAVQVDAVNSRY